MLFVSNSLFLLLLLPWNRSFPFEFRVSVPVATLPPTRTTLTNIPESLLRVKLWLDLLCCVLAYAVFGTLLLGNRSARNETVLVRSLFIICCGKKIPVSFIALFSKFCYLFNLLRERYCAVKLFCYGSPLCAAFAVMGGHLN